MSIATLKLAPMLAAALAGCCFMAVPSHAADMIEWGDERPVVAVEHRRYHRVVRTAYYERECGNLIVEYVGDRTEYVTVCAPPVF